MSESVVPSADLFGARRPAEPVLVDRVSALEDDDEGDVEQFIERLNKVLEELTHDFEAAR
ncbi:MAG: hypothetical protein E7A62_01350 [Actinomycetaceae bacterium]|nr:hypothetical protein [Actinomycetaceae bacterium]MDU0969624.1 hypothetical protein [Actinomycetaceae bacterium]